MKRWIRNRIEHFQQLYEAIVTFFNTQTSF